MQGRSQTVEIIRDDDLRSWDAGGDVVSGLSLAIHQAGEDVREAQDLSVLHSEEYIAGYIAKDHGCDVLREPLARDVALNACDGFKLSLVSVSLIFGRPP